MTQRADSANASVAFVLDDEPEVGAVACKMLGAMGVAARHFVDAAEFLAKLAEVDPNLVLLDLALGKTDAIEVIRQLQSLKFGGGVLLMSGRDQAALQDINRIGRAHGLCMLPPLRKPFRSSDLKSRLLAMAELEAFAAETKNPDIDPDRHRIRMDLGEALQHNRLEVWYQPKLLLGSQAVCGAEALIRARHPVHGLITPAQLLPPPGDPLYEPLSCFVVQQAMTDWASLADKGLPLRLAVNIPASILIAPGFAKQVRQILPESPAFPGLIIEITEDELIRDSEQIHEVATQLRLYDVRISIDDFGIGNSSLSRLRDLPFVELKLDRSFVLNCATDPLKRTLCASVVDLAHRLGALACAEGVETEADLRCLERLGFDSAQGFLFSKPMPLAGLTAFALDRQTQHPKEGPLSVTRRIGAGEHSYASR
jgi:EAL domain-containing protein (putative c-di-GMP-specific phosphodiesterase class I)/FixJ family two-component response regulator